MIALLSSASPARCEETLGALLWAPEHLDKISGEFHGLGSQPGAFLVLANKLLALGGEQDFIELTNRQNVMSRIMVPTACSRRTRKSTARFCGS